MSAIFVLLVLATLGAVGLSLVQSADAGFINAEAKERSYLAAREGLEWAAFQAAAYKSCVTPDGIGNVGGHADWQAGNPNTALGGFNRGYHVTCSSVDGVENGNTVRIMTFVSTGYVAGASKASSTLQTSIVVNCTGSCPP